MPPTNTELSYQGIASCLHTTAGRLNLGLDKQLSRVVCIKELTLCCKD